MHADASFAAPDRVLVVDRSGRGHALCDLLLRTDPDVVVHYGPGNPFVAHERLVHAPEISLADSAPAVRYCRERGIDLAVVSHVDALVAGFVDHLRASGIATAGPTARAAALEGSKARMRAFCARAAIPIAAGRAFTSLHDAKAYVRQFPEGLVVKADDLCPMGDGATGCEDVREAIEALNAIARDRAAREEPFRAVVEERLVGGRGVVAAQAGPQSAGAAAGQRR